MIYVLEDDASIQKLVVYTLNSQGMEARGFDRPSQFWSALALEKPELVLLDIMLPEEDGLQVLKKLRADPATRRTPVLMLTAKSTEYDKVLGLDQGADDYIAKPFGMMELMARIRTALRHAGGREEPETVYRLGQLYVDPGRHIVRDGERDVALTLKEFQLLCLLLEHRGTVFTRDQLLNTIWGSTGQAAPWMSISAPCARSWGSPAAASKRCGAWAIRSPRAERKSGPGQNGARKWPRRFLKTP